LQEAQTISAAGLLQFLLQQGILQAAVLIFPTKEGTQTAPLQVALDLLTDFLRIFGLTAATGLLESL